MKRAKVEDHVVSLNLAIKLKEIGIPTNSLFYYDYAPHINGGKLENPIVDYLSFNCVNTPWSNRKDPESFVSAFTASELLELFPNKINDIHFFEIIKSETNHYYIGYIDYNDGLGDINFKDSNLCNALAKMLIHLIQNKIIELPK